MNVALEAFLTARLPFPGLAAFVARDTEGKLLQQAYGKGLAPAHLEQAFTRLLVAVDSLRHQQLEAVRLCWTFEHLRIYFARRTDGACLALLVENHPRIAMADLESVLAEFAQ